MTLPLPLSCLSIYPDSPIGEALRKAMPRAVQLRVQPPATDTAGLAASLLALMGVTQARVPRSQAEAAPVALPPR